MQAELLLGLERGGLAGLVSGAVDLRVLQVLEVNFVNGLQLGEQGFLGALAPVIRGGNDDALGVSGGRETGKREPTKSHPAMTEVRQIWTQICREWTHERWDPPDCFGEFIHP